MTTSCWMATDRKTLEPTKEDTPHPKTKEKAQWDGMRGTITIKSNPISTGWVTHKLENNFTAVLSLKWRFWAPCWASQPGGPATELGIPSESGFEAQWDMIAGLRGHMQSLVHTRIQRKEAVTPQECEPNLHARIRRCPAEVGVGVRCVAVAHHGNRRTSSVSSGKCPLAWALPEAAIGPNIQPVGGWVPQAKQLTGREHSLTHQQTSGLKFYWAQPCPPEQDPVLPTTSTSHQEDCTNLLDSLIHQRADSRIKKNYSPAACGMETTVTES